jgi:osmotically-inducible protein OsmY
MTQTLTMTDADLKRSVVAELDWNPRINSTRIGVAVDHGTVTLSGEVDTYPEKYLAEKTVLATRGILAVAEEMTVRSTWGEATDTDIAREATEALERAIDVPKDSIKVAVRDHYITLSGPVTWHYQREAAHRAVRYLRGVAGVVNTVIVTPTLSTADIKASITAALVRSAQLDGKNIQVTHDAGTVTLTGRVASWAELRHADHVAWSAPGVTSVRNQLKVNL